MNTSESDEIIIIPDPTGDRYGSFGFMSWWKQERVRGTTVMVIGAGALGNEVLKNLALMGIGRLFIVDFDIVEPGNLSRSVLFRVEDSGECKAEVAARAVRALNPDVAAQAFHGDVNRDLGLGVFRRMDAIIGCLDNREARLSVNRCCWQLGKPWIDGGIQALMGYARVFWPGKGACYECTLTERDYELINLRLSCGLLARQNLLQGKVPTTPTVAAIIGGIQTQEALKLLHGMEVAPGTSFVFNGLTNNSYTTKLPEKADCLSHASLDEIVELPAARASTASATDLIAVARGRMGDGVRLFLGHDLVVALRCPRCGRTSPTLELHDRLTERAAQCPVCEELRVPEVVNELTGDEPFARLPLSKLGVPPLAILTAFCGEQTLAMELTGDDATFFDFR